MKKPTILAREGFWGSDEDKTLPMPVPKDKPWKGKRAFLEALGKLEAKATPNHYKGHSECRVCGERNGSKEYKYHGWCWPSGFAHYVLIHNVRPSLAFQEFVLGHYADATTDHEDEDSK